MISHNLNVVERKAYRFAQELLYKLIFKGILKGTAVKSEQKIQTKVYLTKNQKALTAMDPPEDTQWRVF